MNLLSGIDHQPSMSRTEARVRLHVWLKRLEGRPLLFSARCAVFGNQHAGTNLLTVIVGHPSNAPPPPEATHNYERLTLTSRHLAQNHLLQAFDSETGVIPGIENPAPLLGFIKLRAIQKAAHNELSEYPGLLMMGSLSPPNVDPSYTDPVVSLEGRYYRDAEDAACDWCGFSTRLRAEPLFGLAIFVPDPRARIDNIALRRAHTTVRVQRTTSETLTLKGVASSNPRQSFELIVPDDGHAAELAFQSLDMSLLDSKGRVIDFSRSEHYEPRRHTVFVEAPTNTLELLEGGLRSGETEHVEYKPIVDPKHEKFGELIRCTIAFMNTLGGTILVGVRNDGTRCGLGRDKWFRSRLRPDLGLEAVAAEYASTLRQQILDQLARAGEITATPVTYENDWLVVIRVPEAAAKPVSDHEGNVWVRAGSTTRRAHPVYDPQMFSGDGAKT